MSQNTIQPRMSFTKAEFGYDSRETSSKAEEDEEELSAVPEFQEMECMGLEYGNQELDAPLRNNSNGFDQGDALDDLKKAVNLRVDLMEQNMNIMLKRILNEVRFLRSENATLRARIQGHKTTSSSPSESPSTSTKIPEHKTRAFRNNRKSAIMRKKFTYSPLDPEFSGVVLPREPFQDVASLDEFEESLQSNNDRFDRLVSDLMSIEALDDKKYIRQCWRKICVDRVAENFTWKGTATKRALIDMKITDAIRTAFREKFADLSNKFDKVSGSHFLYAHDRQLKLMNYQARKNSANTSKH